eukprot:2153377-Amphidinium_carterae.1
MKSRRPSLQLKDVLQKLQLSDARCGGSKSTNTVDPLQDVFDVFLLRCPAQNGIDFRYQGTPMLRSAPAIDDKSMRIYF